MVSTRKSAECTALRAHTMPIAPRTATGARTQNVIASPVPTLAASARTELTTGTLRSHGGTRVGQGADVVVLLVLAQPHVVRRLLHAGQQRREQHLLGEDEVAPAVPGQLVLVAHGQRAGRAGLDAQPAEDAAGVVDLVRGGVALAGRVPGGLGVVAALDVDRVRRAGPRAQLAADALLQPVRVAVEDVPAVEPGRGRSPYLRVLLGDHLLEHVREGDPEPSDRIQGTHGCSSEEPTDTGSRWASIRFRCGLGGTRRSIGGTGKPPSWGGTSPGFGPALRLGHSSSTPSATTAAAAMMVNRCRPVTDEDCMTLMPASARIHTRLTGSSTFQPNRMNWSYRSRGKVPRSHTNTNSRMSTFAVNHSSGHQPELAPCHTVVIGAGARQPPRNSVVHRPETVTMLTYSARKNSANFSDEYSVWNPPTSSDSASGRSNGARLVSPTADTK